MSRVPFYKFQRTFIIFVVNVSEIYLYIYTCCHTQLLPSIEACKLLHPSTSTRFFLPFTHKCRLRRFFYEVYILSCSFRLSSYPLSCFPFDQKSLICVPPDQSSFRKWQRKDKVSARSRSTREKIPRPTI